MLVTLKVVLGSLTQLVLLVVSDAPQAAAIAIILAEADFDEYQHVVFCHDDIDLTVSALVIPCHRF